MDTSVHFTSKTEHVSAEVQSNPAHRVRASIDASGNHVLFDCSSRLALYEFGRSLMHEALFGGREIEFFPLVADGKALVVNGVRLSEDSARVFLHFPEEGRNVA